MRQVLLSVALFIACAPSQRQRSEAPSTRQCHTGTLGVLSGANPELVLATSEKRLVLIAGSQTIPATLERATIEACGVTRYDEGTQYGRLTVESFDLRSIDGRPAILGRLVDGTSGLAIMKADGSSWRLEGAVDGLRGKDGERLWVAGAISNGSIRVNSYGFVSK